MFDIVLITKRGSWVKYQGGFTTRHQAGCYAAAALRGTLCAKKSNIAGYKVVPQSESLSAAVGR